MTIEPHGPAHTPVVVLGDQATTAQHAQLAGVASAHGRTIAKHATFAVGALNQAADLTQHDAVIDAGVTATGLGCPVWLPYPTDLGCEDNIRRLHLGLRSVGVTLLVGPELTALPDDAALSPLDKALRVEVSHVQSLAATISAAAGVKPLIDEITNELIAAASEPDHVPTISLEWDQEVLELERYARTLATSGMTQTEIAEHLNGLGHRTKRGRPWSQVQVSRLLSGQHRPESASGDGQAA
jgi:hypothetical protein